MRCARASVRRNGEAVPTSRGRGLGPFLLREGDTAQYVAGTMPVGVSHYLDRANVREEHFVGMALLRVEIESRKIRLVINTFHRQRHTDDMQAVPVGFRLIVPVRLNQNGLADVVLGGGGIQNSVVASYGCNPPQRSSPFRSAGQPAACPRSPCGSRQR